MAVNPSNTGYYFKNVTGKVPNKYLVTISGMDIQATTFYAKAVSLPYIKLNTANDIYVSATSLAKPKYVTSAEVSADLGITFRELPNMGIANTLRQFHSRLSNGKYEATDNVGDITVNVVIYNSDGSTIVKNYPMCELISLNDIKLDYSSRKFLEYEVTFTCNQMGDPYNFDNQKATISLNTSVANDCNRLQKNLEEALRVWGNAYKIELGKNIFGSAIDYQSTAYAETFRNNALHAAIDAKKCPAFKGIHITQPTISGSLIKLLKDNSIPTY